MGRLAWAVGVGLLLLVALLPTSGRTDDLSSSYERGMQLYRQQRYQEAVPPFERVVRLSEQIYGPEDPRIAVDLNNLGEAYRRAGRLPEAERALERAIRLDRSLGGETPALATSLNNLALVYRAGGRPQDAIPLHERALVILRRSLGPRHPDVARALSNEALTSLAAGDGPAATKAAAEALDIARGTLGPQDPTTRAIARTLERARTTPASAPASSGPAPPPLTMLETGKQLPPPPSALAPLPQPLKPLAPPPASQPPSRPATAGLLPPARRPTTTPAVRPPAPPPASSAAAKASAVPAPAGRPAASPGKYALHLGSVRSIDAARGEWRRLAGLYPPLTSLRQLDPEAVEVAGKGTYYRVLAGYLPTREAAAELCVQVRSGGVSCDVRQR